MEAVQGFQVSERATKTFESRGLNGRDNHVHAIKSAAAELWQWIDNIPVPPGNTEAGRLVALAKTDLESSVMWAVKAISRG